MNEFYKNTSKRHLQKLVEERDYYIANMESKDISSEAKEGYRLMADFYEGLIFVADNHIARYSQEETL